MFKTASIKEKRPTKWLQTLKNY